MSPWLRGGPNTKLRTVVWKLDSNSGMIDDHNILVVGWRPLLWLTTKCFLHIRSQSYARQTLQSDSSNLSRSGDFNTMRSVIVPWTLLLKLSETNMFHWSPGSRCLISVTRKTKCRHGQQLVPGLTRGLVSSEVSLPLSLINNTRALPEEGYQRGR